MSEAAPERIWVCRIADYYENPVLPKPPHFSPDQYDTYVRADLHAALQQRVEELEAALPQWRSMNENPDAPMPVLLFYGEREWRDFDGNTVVLDCPHRHAARMEVAFWDGEAWCEQNTGHDVFEPWNEHPTAWQPLTPPEQQ